MIVWAKSNGNWSDTTLWAFWNEVTQQIEDYGQVPQVDDVVYANGYTITLNVNINIGSGKLSNGSDADLGIAGGGSFACYQNSRTIVANLEHYAFSDLITQSNNNLVINGNVSLNDNSSQYWCINKAGAANGVYGTLNGNVTGNVAGGNLLHLNQQSNGFSETFTINGNVFNAKIYMHSVSSSNINYLTINGTTTDVNINNAGKLNYVINGNVNQLNSIINANFDTLYVSGNYRNETSSIPLIKYLTIGGNIYYMAGLGGFATSDLTYIDESNTNYYALDANLDIIVIKRSTIAQTYPTEDKVLAPTQYGAQMELVGTYTPDYPPESVVLKDYVYDDGDKVGSLESQNIVGCVTPEDVRKDVPLVGMGVVGSLVVPSVDDVREGVVFDNGSVGTLIVQGGGDRLRIADFGYYTDSQSDTYIVDLTEQDKPKFAVAEERVLIEMFPDLDFNNIPDKYFDDLLVKYLKYRLIVEYYRTAGINSTFTPSEPTTEIVNYRNVNCEIWMNIANTYLKAWGEKYPNSIKKQRILL